MRNGWPCWKGRGRLAGAVLAVSAALLWIGYWWAGLPRTPEALFRVRCSTCHELRTARLCEFARELRPAIVDTMRFVHGADKVIDDGEARLIAAYLKSPNLCGEPVAIDRNQDAMKGKRE